MGKFGLDKCNQGCNNCNELYRTKSTDTELPKHLPPRWGDFCYSCYTRFSRFVALKRSKTAHEAGWLVHYISYKKEGHDAPPFFRHASM